MKELTDVHVHLAALPTNANGCLVSAKMLRRQKVSTIVLTKPVAGRKMM